MKQYLAFSFLPPPFYPILTPLYSLFLECTPSLVYIFLSCKKSEGLSTKPFQVIFMLCFSVITQPLLCLLYGKNISSINTFCAPSPPLCFASQFVSAGVPVKSNNNYDRSAEYQIQTCNVKRRNWHCRSQNPTADHQQQNSDILYESSVVQPV